MGATLSQMVDGKPQPLYLFSKLFNKSFLPKSIYDKELESAFQAIKKFDKFLLGQRVVLYVDNEALAKSIAMPKDKPWTEQRRLMYISQFVDEVVHIRSEENAAADYLSRLECKAIKLEPKINYERLFNEQQSDPYLSGRIPDDKLRRKKVNFENKEFNVWFYETVGLKNLIVVPDSQINHVIAAFHNLCHPGQKATVRFIASRFYWPTLKKDCRSFVKHCIRCQTAKKSKHQIVPISRIETPSNRFEHLHIDLVGPLPIVDGYLHLLTIIDRSSRFFTAIPIKNKSTKSTWSALLTGWVQYFGLPKVITTDRAKNFTSKEFDQMCELFGIHHIKTCSYNPKANGLIENYHRKLKNSLRALRDDRWLDRLLLVILAWNNAVREDGLFSPSQIVFGSQLLLPGDFFEKPQDQPKRPSIELMRSYMEEMTNLRTPETAGHQNRYTNIVIPDLMKSNFVFELDSHRTGLNQTYKGPFEVIERNEKYFKIRRPSGIDSVSTDRLKPAYLIEE